MYSNSERKFLSIFLVLLLCGLAVLILTPKQKLPDDGVWYCDALQIEISFDDGSASAVVSGKKMHGVCQRDDEKNRITLICREEVHPDFRPGDVLFTARFIRLDENKLVVLDEKIEKEYTFLKIG